jgi:hypothetical protein
MLHATSRSLGSTVCRILPRACLEAIPFLGINSGMSVRRSEPVYSGMSVRRSEPVVCPLGDQSQSTVVCPLGDQSQSTAIPNLRNLFART